MILDIKSGVSFPRTRVVCPDCGAGGASTYICWCHKCSRDGSQVVMLPATNDTITQNWVEFLNKVN